MLPMGAWRPYRKKHTFRAVLLVSAVFLAGAMFMAFYRHPASRETAAVAQENILAPAVLDEVPLTLPESIRTGLPDGWPLVRVAPLDHELWAGKLLLINEDHPVPALAPPPNTLSISEQGEGQIAVRSLKPNTDMEVIQALKQLFSMARSSGVTSWLIWEGSRSIGQQLQLQLERLALYAQTVTLTAAAQKAAGEVPAPGFSEHQLPYVVDIRLADGWNVIPDDAPLEASSDGRLLLDSAWQCGFIHRYGKNPAPPYEDEAYHFRYVGLVHSTIMHALKADLPRYLALLRKESAITYYEAGEPRYAVLCQPAEEGMTFSIPAGCPWEGSMDNTGYAVIAVTFPKAEE